MKIESDCPHCKKPIGIDTDKMKIKETVKEIEHPEATSQSTVLEKPEVIEKEVITTVAPEDQPLFKCKNCDDLHHNKNYTQRPNKRCKNCDSLNGSVGCTKCGNKDPDNFEELDNDELNDLGIPEPKDKDHEHESK